MSGLSPEQRARLDRFMALVMIPCMEDPAQVAETHSGMAKAMLATTVRWSALDLAFLRWAAAGGADSGVDYPRLERLMCQAMERTA
ncbi:hypothetical protein N0B51_09630 [Tsuneonella sp. YG55]|uniref:Uncharacterized protein n=1 Tax=Tsuneonella litorea TaxID=2976475 RepID=A0A9X2W299_9SPHN|nr:hypothetical protein [Tsuneonella litorea]MCT2559244.1 hypothetical protein [Tsuneonella litorea]